MPTIIWERGYQVVVNTNDHGPPHVHVRKDGADVKIMLLHNGIRLHSIKGRLSSAKIREAGLICIKNLENCWEAWQKLYG